MTTIRRRLPDAPGCEAHNAEVRRARADYAEHPATRWCEFLLTDDGEPCCEPVDPPVGRYCKRHRGAVRRRK